MAERRMIAKKIVSSDSFLGMPMTTQNLYFHLSIWADDDGFIDNIKSIMAMTKANEDDLRILIAKHFVIPFESSVIVITHWRINNYLRNDRYTETQYLEEKAQLVITSGQPYRVKAIEQSTAEQIPLLDQQSTTKATTSHQTPTLDEIKQYCIDRQNCIDAEYFFNYYQDRKWYCGKTKVTDWQGLIRQWEQNQKNRKNQKQGGVIDYDN